MTTPEQQAQEAKNRELEKDIAARWPTEYARAADTRPGRSKRLARLRRRWHAERAWEAWRAEHPTARCATCAEYGKHPTTGERVCDLGYEKGGWYQPVKPEHVCMLWHASATDSSTEQVGV